MNIQQLEYVLAVAEEKHFESASKRCCVTQSTLSTMISRFEDELGIVIFDRKKRPVELTTEGESLLEQIKIILWEIDNLGEISNEIKGEVKGNFSISVIPTIAPFLLPLFLQEFAAISIKVKEQPTSEILRQLKSRELDVGIISIPVKDKDIREIKLYDEPFVFYDAGNGKYKMVSIQDLDTSNLCLLEEQHCMRTQILKLCDLQDKLLSNKLNFEYKAGSIHSLLRFVRANQASTLLPWLSTTELSEDETKHVSQFSQPVPFRTIGLVVHRHFVKKKILDGLQNDILDSVKNVLPKLEMEGSGLEPV